MLGIGKDIKVLNYETSNANELNTKCLCFFFFRDNSPCFLFFSLMET